MLSSLLWNEIFGHLNYNSLRLLRNNNLCCFPTIPKQRNKSHACILGKHSKHPFQESKFRACRMLEPIHYDLCGPIPIPSTNRNKYHMEFAYDYSRMCWVIY